MKHVLTLGLAMLLASLLAAFLLPTQLPAVACDILWHGALGLTAVGLLIWIVLWSQTRKA